MSKVLVLGASGLIGFSVATAFVKEGSKLWTHEKQREGIALNQEWEYELHILTSSTKRVLGVIPIVGKAQEVASWMDYAENSDIIIEALADYQVTLLLKCVAYIYRTTVQHQLLQTP